MTNSERIIDYITKHPEETFDTIQKLLEGSCPLDCTICDYAAWCVIQGDEK